MYDIGIDYGGTSIAIGLVTGTRLADSVTISALQGEEVEQTVERIAQAVDMLLFRNVVSMEDIRDIGVGVPGTANLETGLVEYANNIGFQDVPFVRLLGNRLGREVAFDNDANAAALGEYRMEKSGAHSFVLVTLGTGIGCGIVLDGELYRGVNYAAGEIGHMTIRYDGRPCNCGRRGCMEAYASVSALMEMTCEAMTQHQDSLLWKLCGNDVKQMDGQIFFEAVRQGDQTALALREQYTEYLAQGLANLINLLQPEELVIGGGISMAADDFLPQTIDRLGPLLYSKTSARNTKIHAACAGNEAGMVGAALLASLSRCQAEQKGDRQ